MARYSKLASPSATRAVLEEFGLTTKYRLGQNFLISDTVIGRIIELAEPSHNDIVLEVGPGIGTLTCALLPRSLAVVAIEADGRLTPVLNTTCAGLGRMALIEGDATRVSAQRISQAVSSVVPKDCASAPTAFIANLPYQVAATLVLRYLEEIPSIERAVVMVQTEVAHRMMASPHTKAYGAYTAKLALVGRVVDHVQVDPQNFLPAPHVNSTVVKIERVMARHPDTHEVLTDREHILCGRVIDAAFLQRRKMIRNSMRAAGFNETVLDAAYAAAHVDPTCRAESLAPAAFIRLSRVIAALLSEQQGK